jgi:hypothetical protein
MNQRSQEMHPEDEHIAAPSSPEAADEPARTSRRELIERFAKAATIVPPLVMFVSKARAIHSKP